MKVLEVRKTTIRTDPQTPDTANYLDLAAACLNAMPERGFAPDEMRVRMRVLDAIEQAQAQESSHLTLEDADAAKLQACVQAMHWRVLDRQLLEFTDAVANMPAPAPDLKLAAKPNAE